MTQAPKRSFVKNLMMLPLGMLGVQVATAESKLPPRAVSAIEKQLADLRERQSATESRQQITDVLHRYARGWDRLDEETLRSCFHSDSTHQHGGFKGLSHDFITAGWKSVQVTKSMTHMISNIMIELEGDQAVSECYFLAHHRRPAKTNPEEDMDWFLKGRYLDRFERRNGEWKISHRTGLSDFARTFVPADTSFDSAPREQISLRKPNDPIYQLFKSLND